MRVRIGHTPDADDAFMFYAIAEGKVTIEGVEVEHVVEDIERLNRMALRNELDVTAISAHAYAYTKGYAILRSGASFGLSYGPILVARHAISSIDELAYMRIAVPGKLTTAYLLLEMALRDYLQKDMDVAAKIVEMRFDEIEDAVLSSKVDAGLLIHEAQIAYRQGLHKLLDLGEWWSKVSNGLPLPLGIDVASLSLGEISSKISILLKQSIAYAYEHFDDAVDYAMRYSRGKDRGTIARFVRMYVNDLAMDMDEVGYNALKRLYSLASSRGIINEPKIILV
ncbi:MULTISPECIES: menaquinone biosynthesis family protein [Candidatus Nitrosocaldus]|jgi:1,4-dihydroxy-6-naphthoate synthase|uniref:1,4-dihydroxy-6-naphtoate synthase n=1 Tax=Candidatus Nitrosocaldus cavascurensis TaxID=2058097 RepID=A0A2K5ARQ4_9ARCH|nr:MULTISPECIES: MqnA/MqnD/SBP family protein [Candidatus Nitrosocaldus]SPC34274.1 1,4-dihydroxy-6-naphtoate synthase [Candidatus Nitrosocaldus cavascurensis]